MARFVDQFMTETGTRPTGPRRGFDHDAGRRVISKADAPNHVWHCSLSLSPQDGPLSDDAWRQITAEFMESMGFTGVDGKAPCRWVAVHHGRSKNGGDHVHIVANIVREDGTKWSNWQDQRRAGRAVNAIEHRHNLTVIEAREHSRGARADSTADLRVSARRGEERTDRQVLEHRVRAAATAARSERDFVLRLRGVGVRARPRFARGRTDVVVGYSVALHRPDGQAQWYGGGRVARDLTLQRLRARWPDTPHSAQQAVDAWRDAWRGVPRRTGINRSQVVATARALNTYADTLGGIDATDPVVLADATRDVAGLLSAQALAERDPKARRVLERAALTAGRAAQTHHRPAPVAPVPGAVAMAASVAMSATMNRQANPAVLAVQSLALLRSLADLYHAAQQARTAQQLLAEATTALEAVSNAPSSTHVVAAVGAPSAPQRAGRAPDPQPETTPPHRQEQDAAAGQRSPQIAGGPPVSGVSQAHADRIRRITEIVGAPSAPQRASRAPSPQPETTPPHRHGDGVVKKNSRRR
ncbi:relaxase/mobilization nuclease domain-containing protein [Actinomyces oricola]